jgi:Bacterial membrane protein YfhO
MNSAIFKKALPHLIAIAVFILVAIVYCRPALEGKVVGQSDVEQWKAMAQQSYEYKDKNGHFPLWTESAFGGMPTYTITMDAQGPVHYGYLLSVLQLGLPQPINFFFLACVCFYIMLAVLRVNPWVGIMAALAYAYCSYDPVIIVTGHVTKMMAIGLAPGVIAGVLLLFRRQYLWGTALLSFFFAAQVGTQHLQIVFYTVISMGLLTLCYAIDSLREGTWKEMAIGIGLAVVGAGIGFGTSLGSNLPLQEYTKETMRGGRTELTKGASEMESKGGLSKSYAFDWSYGIGETLTLAVPDIYGGGAGAKSEIGDNSKLADRLAQDLNIPEDTGLQFANGYAYWGAQPFTEGTVYLGAVICFLCIFGLVVLRGWPKWWLLSVIVVGIVLAWGKNFSAFNYFLFDHFPYYNKFRSPSTALFMPQLAAPALAAVALNYLLTADTDMAGMWKKFKTTAYITGAALVLLIGFYLSASYQGKNDAELKDRFMQIKMQQLSQTHQAGPDAQQQAVATAGSLMKALEQDRQSIAGADLLRTVILIVLAGILLGLFMRKKIKAVVLLAGLVVLSSYDLLAVSARYLNQDSYLDPADFQSSLNPTPADQQISSDPDKNFRVVDESGQQSPFESARASYFHNSVGGYSPAKLGLYQDLIDNQLRKGNMEVYDMLNAKYFIQPDQRSGQPVARLNPGAFGPCWLVRAIHYVKGGDEEMKTLDSTDLRDTAVVEQQFAARIPFMPTPDSSASLHLVDNQNDKIDYKFSARASQFAVFSEIYYDKGWNAYLDGNKTDYVRVDYVLRGMAIPAGSHTIEFRFEPRSYKVGMMLATWFNLAVYLLLMAGLVMEWRKRIPAKAAPGA